jgi:hypothetical protein
VKNLQDSPYRTNHTKNLVLEVTVCALQMVVCDLVHQYHIDQTVNRSTSVTPGQSFATYAKRSGRSRHPASFFEGYWMVLSRGQSGQGVRLTTDLIRFGNFYSSYTNNPLPTSEMGQ